MAIGKLVTPSSSVKVAFIMLDNYHLHSMTDSISLAISASTGHICDIDANSERIISHWM